MTQFRYPCLLIKQTTADKPVVFFAAPASEIEQWSGVPQKKRFGTDAETVGFQREVSTKRLASLRSFFAHPENIIQNPLLCSTRQNRVASVQFEPSTIESTDPVQFGRLVITIPDFDSFTLEQIFEHVRRYIEDRVPELANMSPEDTLTARLKQLAVEHGVVEEAAFSDPADSDSVDDQDVTEAANTDAEAILFEESHILDFWQEVAGRHEVLKLLEHDQPTSEFLSFTRDALISYIKPIVLVDGQHRLSGALHATDDRMNAAEIMKEVERRVGEGEDPDAVHTQLLRREGRHLPVSLLMSEDAAEQVFQFVVVNQKATPVGRALLGTIVSTTLSNEEMTIVADRLKAAGVELEEAQAITYLARHQMSPFKDRVQRGLADDAPHLLQWNVFASLVRIFRELHGGSLFGIDNDYAGRWKLKYLEHSEIVSEYEDADVEQPFHYWHQLDGPWRDVFIKFFTCVRDRFGNTSDEDAHNFWGRPRSSNLFNKVSLTILAADFFQFLNDGRHTISSADAIERLVDDWLLDVNSGYFNRDWGLEQAGLKKDSRGIRNQWAFLWTEYRKNPSQLPQARLYRQPRGN